MSNVLDAIEERVAITPVAVSSFDPPDDAPTEIVHLEAHLRAHGEVIVEVEERGPVELHRGNTEFDYELGAIKVDPRDDVVTVPMDRVTVFYEHYET